MSTFPVGNAGKRELRTLLRNTTDPFATIREFQESHSLHSMLAKAFGTTPRHATNDSTSNKRRTRRDSAAAADAQQEKSARKPTIIEPLDTDSVLMFLSHLGVSSYEVHKRIADALRSQLEEEIRKESTSKDGLLKLLQSCWAYTTTIPELRPVLWTVLKQLGSDTPLPVLIRLAERDKDGKSLKFAEVWHPLPPLLKRLVWEADWAKRIPTDEDGTPPPRAEFLQASEKTLFGEQLQPLIEAYVQHPVLVEAANRPFVASARERQLLTTKRRITSAATKDSELDKAAKAISSIKELLVGGESRVYRPKLVYAAFSILMAHHGGSKSAESLLGGPAHLYCTLLSDLLLSGPVPKAYQALLSLARALDETVKAGVMDDQHISQVQNSLRQIFQLDEMTSTSAGDSKDDDKKKQEAPWSSGEKRVLRGVIKEALAAMKEADPQSLFLNPVTDDIAPGYSKVIEKPICIKEMEAISSKDQYKSLQEWEKEVKVMYQNCQTYNVGKAGLWFRGEARRQKKVFSEEIFPQAKRLFQTEMNKQKPAPPPVNDKEKKRTIELVEPLAGGVSSNKKRKRDPNADVTPSIPALASMLLCDPFVIRLLLDRTLKSLRLDIWKGGANIPRSHGSIPSIQQLLLMAQLSGPLCAIRGKRYEVPDAGLALPLTDVSEPSKAIPYRCLRQYTPLVLKLLVEADLDRRVAGELSAAAQSMPPRTIDKEVWAGTAQLSVLRAMVQGALVHVCQPGYSYDTSLSVTLPKFSAALHEFKLWEDGPFFQSLVNALTRHKSKLGRTNRDVIFKVWLDWIDCCGEAKLLKRGAILSDAHRFLVALLADWGGMGNLLLPRDKLLEFSQTVVDRVNTTEKKAERKFGAMWNEEAFASIRAEYERILKVLPESHVKKWRERVNIPEDDEGGGLKVTKTEVDD